MKNRSSKRRRGIGKVRRGHTKLERLQLKYGVETARTCIIVFLFFQFWVIETKKQHGERSKKQ
jgi:hypothetical protein